MPEIEYYDVPSFILRYGSYYLVLSAVPVILASFIVYGLHRSNHLTEKTFWFAVLITCALFAVFTADQTKANTAEWAIIQFVITSEVCACVLYLAVRKKIYGQALRKAKASAYQQVEFPPVTAELRGKPKPVTRGLGTIRAELLCERPKPERPIRKLSDITPEMLLPRVEAGEAPKVVRQQPRQPRNKQQSHQGQRTPEEMELPDAQQWDYLASTPQTPSRKKYIKHILLILAGGILFAFSLSAYLEAGKHLTPYSVSVSGYYRRNGTYVRPYQRRPPGGAIHDTPYESKRTLCFFLMVIGVGLVIFPVYLIREDIKSGQSQYRLPRPPIRE